MRKRDAGLPRAFAALLHLVHGAPGPERELTDAEWLLTLEVATRERCVVLAWSRSADTIRACAPAAVAARWRGCVIRACEQGRRLFSGMQDALDALASAAISAAVLKGPPLSALLYADPFVRMSTDVDLYVADEDRAGARAAVLGAGWTPYRITEAPFEEIYYRSGPEPLFLELHGSLLGDELVHLSLPVLARETVRVEDRELPVIGEVVLPVYLSVHLAQHQLPPLLWLVDLRTLWERLSTHEQREAASVATTAGIDRYLRWALHRTALLEQVMGGDSRALEELGIRARERVDVHPLWRHLSLAPDWRTAVRSAGAVLLPRSTRRSGRLMTADLLRRLRVRSSVILRARQRYGEAVAS